jgi:hypothetical protein
MKFGKFNLRTLIMATINCFGLTFIALLGAVAVDEGTEGKGVLGLISLIFSKVFNVLRFPSHTLFFDWMNGSLFFVGLFINCILYGFAIERLISISKIRE